MKMQLRVSHTTGSPTRINSSLFRSMFSSINLVMALTIALLFGPAQGFDTKQASSMYTGALTNISQVYFRPGGSSDQNYYFQAVRLSVPASGTYTLTSNSSIDVMGYLYETYFDPSNPLINLITSNDDDGGNLQFLLQAFIQILRSYVLVVTTHISSTMGTFSVSSNGSRLVTFAALTPTTSRPIVTATPIPSRTSNFSGALTLNSLVFNRPGGEASKIYYFQALRMTITTAGTYTIRSNSTIDTMGYLYYNSFDPSSPTTNLVMQDDDSDSMMHQFRIRAYLQLARTYVLAVTTHPDTLTGNFSLTVVGPANIGLMPVTPVTSRPIVTVSTLPTITSTYSNTLSSSSQSYIRPDGSSDELYYFQAIQFTVSTAGTYSFQSNSNLDTIGYFYSSSFDPSNSSLNLLSFNDDDGDIFLQFKIQLYLQSGATYVLVVTTHGGSETGPFTVTAIGPATLTLTSITASTSRPIVTPSIIPSIVSTIASTLSTSSQFFIRPEGDINSLYYFQAIQVNIATSGTYTFTTRSGLDTMGYFYSGSFDAANPSMNLISDDDDGSGTLQFEIVVSLQAGATYILAVTTHGNRERGDFSLLVYGPASVGLMAITTSTSSPIVSGSTPAPARSYYNGSLSQSSQAFIRPEGDPTVLYYLQAIQVTVTTTGRYSFTSNSTLDMMGYFYGNPFDPSNPSANLITDDDDGADDYLQFHFNVVLQGGSTYVLVVTTHVEYTTGDFSIVARGPSVAILTSIVASTSRPIVVPSTPSTVSTVYNGELSMNSQSFYRPEAVINNLHYFQAIQITVTTSGTYSFTSNTNIDTMGYLYAASFDPSNPTANLITDDDDGGISLQFRIETNLQSGQMYILVVTTHMPNKTANFSVTAVGPAAIAMTLITASTSQPIVTQSAPPQITSVYPSTLSPSSQIFYRPSAIGNTYYYFQAIQISVSISGIYTFSSNSTIDTRGYFYNAPFDASQPNQNLIADNDDSGGSLQFRIQLSLLAGRTYVLVVTTHRENTIGGFSVIATGPSSTSLMAITASTSRPITTVATTTIINSSFAGILTVNSQFFFRPSGVANKFYYFQALQVTTTRAGTYVFRSNSTLDTRAYFYNSSFDPSIPMTNLIEENDDGGGSLQFRIQVYLQASQTYTLVVTTHRELMTGNFSVTSSGPALVTFTVITPSTSLPITTVTIPPPVNSSYVSALTFDSQIFYRPLGAPNNYYYFEALQITVPRAGTYIFRSNSTLDTRGYFYNATFDPSVPTTNMITNNDDGGGSFQFKIEVYLQAAQVYILVVTTHRERTVGNFTVIGSGPAAATFTKITPSTSLPITTIATTPFTSTSFANTLSSSSQIFYRPGGSSIDFYYFQAIRVTAAAAGLCVFRSNSTLDTRAYFYNSSFDPSSPTANLLAENDDDGGNLQFRIEIYLEPIRSYVLVVTTHIAMTTGNFSLFTSGPARITLSSIVASTSSPITIVTTVPPTLSTYPGLLSLSSQAYYRPSGVSNKFYYFQAFQVTAPTAGTYIFRSNSTLDTLGYFYSDSFDPSDPTTNLIVYNDDAGGSYQFRLSAVMQPAQIYVLVVTTHREETIGNYSVIASGPATVTFTSITPSTSRPITIPITTPTVSSSYSAALSTTSGSFIRPESTVNQSYYFQAVQVTTNTAGLYIFKSASTTSTDTMAYFYKSFFDPSKPTINLVTDNDDGGGGLQFRIEVYLMVGQIYVLVVTTHRPSISGNFAVSAVGPGSVTMTSITPTTTELASYPNALRSTSAQFGRPDGDPQKYYYYEALQITVGTSGRYSLVSVSAIFSVGYFYQTNFNASAPRTNLLTTSIEGGEKKGFRIDYDLTAGTTYILVVTSYDPLVTGDFWILVRGPVAAKLNYLPPSIIASTQSTPTATSKPAMTSNRPNSASRLLSSNGPNSMAIITFGLLFVSMLQIYQRH